MLLQVEQSLFTASVRRERGEAASTKEELPEMYSRLLFVRILVLVPLFISLLTDSEKRGAALSLEQTTNEANELKQ